jgi:hypothetical protein
MNTKEILLIFLESFNETAEKHPVLANYKDELLTRFAEKIEGESTAVEKLACKLNTQEGEAHVKETLKTLIEQVVAETVLGKLEKMNEEITKKLEELHKEHEILNDGHHIIVKNQKALAAGQETLAEIIGRSREELRKEIREAKEEVIQRVADAEYYLTR